MNKKYFLIAVFLLQYIVLSANPFIRKNNSPTPVYQGKPSDYILTSQRILNEKLGNYIAQWKEKKSFEILIPIFGLSFLYGFIHAAGPGHRKTVVFSYYIAKKSHYLEPLLTSMFLAIIHGGTAIILMLILKKLSGAILSKVNDAAIYMEGFSFIILMVFSCLGIIDAIKDIILKKDIKLHNIKLNAILLSGIYPCPAAMLVLILSISLNILTIGIISVIIMSIGMSIPILACAYLAWAGRTSLFYKIKSKEKRIKVINASLQILCYTFLLYISLKTSLPFIFGLLRILKS